MKYGLEIDKMFIKKCVEWDGRKSYGLVDVGINLDDIDDDREATYAFVVMLVALNGHFKTPISYYFIKSLNAEERANLITNNLIILSEKDIKNIRHNSNL